MKWLSPPRNLRREDAHSAPVRETRRSGVWARIRNVSQIGSPCRSLYNLPLLVCCHLRLLLNFVGCLQTLSVLTSLRLVEIVTQENSERWRAAHSLFATLTSSLSSAYITATRLSTVSEEFVFISLDRNSSPSPPSRLRFCREAFEWSF